MKIFLHEISDQEMELDFIYRGSEEKWLLDAVERVDEKLDDLAPSAARSAAAKSRPIAAHFSLRKVDDVVVISGDVETHIQLVCSRCASVYQQKCHPSFAALFCRDPVMAGVAHKETGKVVNHNKGHARHAHDFQDESVAEGKDLDITYLSHDFVNLGDVLTEQLQLQVPFQPLCQEECKGICSHCGADLNRGRCACAKLSTNKNPFSVLKNLKF